MKVLKAVFKGATSMVLGAATMLGAIIIAYNVLIYSFHITGWTLFFYSPLVLLGSILIGVLINVIIYVIIDDVIKFKARKAKKTEIVE